MEEQVGAFLGNLECWVTACTLRSEIRVESWPASQVSPCPAPAHRSVQGQIQFLLAAGAELKEDVCFPCYKGAQSSYIIAVQEVAAPETC